MKIVIIGGQACGMTFAMQLQRHDKNAEIFLIESANYISFGACGLPYYVGDFFTTENYLFAKQVSDITNPNMKIYLQHQALKINHLTKQVDVKNLSNNEVFSLTFDKLLIATGSSPNTLPFNLNLTSTKIHTLKSLDDAKDIKKSISTSKNVGIIGAGYIGLELLESLEHKNLHITLLDSKELVSTNFLDKDFEDILLNEIKTKPNIDLSLNTKILNIIENQHNIIIQTSTKEYIFDCIILATGFKPNTSFLSNIPFEKLSNGALLTNNFGETNIPNIYACGDCASIYHKILQKNMYIPLATIANKMARKVADSMYNKHNSFEGTLGSSCLKMLNLEIAKTGICEFEAILHNIEYDSVFVEDYNHTNYYPNQEKIYIKLLFNKQKEIIGAQIVGKNGAMLRIHALSVAIEKKLTIEELSMLDFAYAPPFTRTWDILNTTGSLATKQSNKINK